MFYWRNNGLQCVTFFSCFSLFVKLLARNMLIMSFPIAIGDKESWKGSMIKLDSPNWSAKLAYIDENVFDVGFWAKLFEGIS